MTGLAFASAPFPHTHSYHCDRVQGPDNLLTLHLARTSELGKFSDYWILDKELNYQTIEYQTYKKKCRLPSSANWPTDKMEKKENQIYFLGQGKTKQKMRQEI
jgi:hypothetical protein